MVSHITLAYGTADTSAEDDVLVLLAEQLREARVPQQMRGRGVLTGRPGHSCASRGP
ncbi:MAG: hypothetical protein ACRDRO_05085 [Pseudonocardiaceae bacterium]